MRVFPFKAVITAALLSTIAATAQADSFTLFIYETPAQIALRSDSGPAGQAYWDGYNRFAATLMQSGALRGGSALTLDAPSPADHILGGYFVIEAPDMAAATALTLTAPQAARVEVRRHAPNPTQPATMTPQP